MPFTTVSPTAAILALLSVMAVAAITLVILRPHLTAGPLGRALAFVAFFVLPALVTAFGLAAHVEHAKTTEFCLSCHVMEPYGESLRIDSDEHLPAVHFQNTLMPRDQACFTCHTTYTMFGDVEAKLRGLRHVWVYYLGEIPEQIALYEPYQNRECLSCHAGARSFEADELHLELRAELASGETSCLECHDQVHDVAHLGELPRWEETAP